MFVIGTAGHVDHGKSALVQALTGIDPDRLQEEKERGMTIDLGFAWLTLPSGREVSIVDVPGHERFIKNMLAGVGGIDLALLVVAADEGVMPQTREHLAILDLLQVSRGIAVVTKTDLVDEEFLELVEAEVAEVLQGTSLEEAPILAVSALRGDGLPELLQTMDEVLDRSEPKKDLGRPRLPIDRSFTISGFGTVVTGTLVDGVLSTGQEVELVLRGLRSRVRGVQTHRKKLSQAAPGSRVAVNLSSVDHQQIERGEVLTIPGWLRPTTALDVHLRLISAAPRPLKHNARVSFHTGASETIARVRLLEENELRPGEETWAQLKLDSSLALVKGDFFVIRSSVTTLGGGNVVDPYAQRHRRLHIPTLEHLAVLEQGSTRDALLQTLENTSPSDLKTLVNRTNASERETRSLLEALAQEGLVVALGTGRLNPGTALYSAAAWQRVSSEARGALETYHQQYRLRKGAPKEELRSRLRLSSQAFPHALARLVQEGVVMEEGPLVRLPEHQIQLSQAQRQRLDEYVRHLQSDPYSPPTDQELEPDLVGVLEGEGRVVRVSEGLIYEAPAYHEMVDRIVQHIRERGKVTVAEVRDMFNTSRKYALPLLEHLDQQHITRRVGDDRVLR